jgi:hypothetical protein
MPTTGMARPCQPNKTSAFAVAPSWRVSELQRESGEFLECGGEWSANAKSLGRTVHRAEQSPQRHMAFDQRIGLANPPRRHSICAFDSWAGYIGRNKKEYLPEQSQNPTDDVDLAGKSLLALAVASSLVAVHGA